MRTIHSVQLLSTITEQNHLSKVTVETTAETTAMQPARFINTHAHNFAIADAADKL